MPGPSTSFTVVLAGGPASIDLMDPPPRPTVGVGQHALLEGAHEGMDGEGGQGVDVTVPE